MSSWGQVDRSRPGLPVDIVMGDEKAHLIVRLLTRSHPGCWDYWDGNWIDSEVRLVAGPFQGRYSPSLRSNEFEIFHRQLIDLDRTSVGKAMYTHLECQLEIALECKESGRVELKGYASDPMHINELHFALDLKRADLPALIQDVGRGLAAFPVLDRP